MQNAFILLMAIMGAGLTYSEWQDRQRGSGNFRFRNAKNLERTPIYWRKMVALNAYIRLVVSGFVTLALLAFAVSRFAGS